MVIKDIFRKYPNRCVRLGPVGRAQRHARTAAGRQRRSVVQSWVQHAAHGDRMARAFRTDAAQVCMRAAVGYSVPAVWLTEAQFVHLTEDNSCGWYSTVVPTSVRLSAVRPSKSADHSRGTPLQHTRCIAVCTAHNTSPRDVAVDGSYERINRHVNSVRPRLMLDGAGMSRSSAHCARISTRSMSPRPRQA